MTVGDLERLFRRNRGGLLRRATKLLGDQDAARDVLQEVFLRALTAPLEGSPLEMLAGWLRRVTTNLCLVRLRDSRRRKRILLSRAASASTTLEPTCDTQLTVRALLRFVPEDTHALVIHYFVDQMSQDEISTITGIPRRTIAYRLEQFRTRARAVMLAEPSLEAAARREGIPSASEPTRSEDPKSDTSRQGGHMARKSGAGAVNDSGDYATKPSLVSLIP